MSAFMETLGQEWVYRLGWTLVHSLWQGALVALVFGALRFGLRRKSANARYWAACVMLGCLAAGPVVTLWTGLDGLVPAWQVGKTEIGVVAAPAVGTATRITTTDPGNSPEWKIGQGAWLDEMLPVIVLSWVAGVGVFGCRWLRGCWQVRRLRTRGVEEVDPAWLEKLNELRERLRVSRPVRLFQSALVEVPTVVGWWSPVILIPASTLVGLTPGQVEAVLAHELAHVSRWDYLVNAMQNLVESLMFYHPTVWWISRCIREEREHCCDDMVVRVCGNTLAYAKALATLEDLRAEIPPLAFAASGGPLLRRIRRLVGTLPEDRPAGLREYGGLTLLGLGLAMVIAGAILLTTSPTYRAVTRIRVEHDMSVRLSSDRGNATLQVQDPYFIQTEFEVIKSDRILGQVVERLKLTEVWGKQRGRALTEAECVQLLRPRLSIRVLPGSQMLELSVVGPAAGEVAQIANELVSCYRDHGIEQEEAVRNQGFDALVNLLAEQDERYRRAAKNVEQLRGDLNITDALDFDSDPPMRVTADSLRKYENLRIENQAEYVRQSSLLANLKRLSPEDQIQAMLGAVQDTLLTSLLEQATVAEQRLVVARKEFGPEHLEVQKTEAQVKDVQARIRQRANGIVLGLEAKVGSIKDGLDALQREVEHTVQVDIAESKRSRPYFEAKKELREIGDFRRTLNAKMLVERANGNISAHGRVELVDRAKIPTRPFSPNRYRASALMVLGFLTGGMGLRVIRVR